MYTGNRARLKWKCRFSSWSSNPGSRGTPGFVEYECHAVLETQKDANRLEEDSCAYRYRSSS